MGFGRKEYIGFANQVRQGKLTIVRRPQVFYDHSVGASDGGRYIGIKTEVFRAKTPWKDGVKYFPQFLLPEAPKGSLAWLCEDNVPYSAYWDPKKDMNVVFVCSNQEWFPPEVMKRLRKTKNFKGIRDISWLWFY